LGSRQSNIVTYTANRIKIMIQMVIISDKKAS